MTIHELYDMTDYLTAVQESLPRKLSMASRRQQLADIGRFAHVAGMLKPRLCDAGVVELVCEIQQKALALQSVLGRVLGDRFQLTAA